MRKKDGTYRWFLVRFNPPLGDKAQIVRWYAACTDSEDRKRAEENFSRRTLPFVRKSTKLRCSRRLSAHRRH